MNNNKNIFKRVIDSLSYKQKFGVIACTFYLAILFLCLSIYNHEVQDINDTRNEILAVQFYNKLRPLAQDAYLHYYFYKLYLDGDVKAREECQRLEASIQDALEELTDFSRQYADMLKINEESFRKHGLQILTIQNLEANWSEVLKHSEHGTQEDVDKLHSQFLRSLQELLNYIIDSCNLLVDPEPDSHGLIESSFVKLPAITNSINTLIHLCNKVALQGNIAQSEHDSIVIHLANLSMFTGQLDDSMRYSYIEDRLYFGDQHIRENTEEALRTYTSLVKMFQAQITKNFLEKQNPTKADFENNQHLFQETIAKTFMLSDLICKELINVLNSREQSLVSQLRVAILTAIVLLITATIVGVYMERQISTPLNSLLRAADQLRQGNMDFRVPVESDDQIGQLAISFNKMVDAIQSLVSKLQHAGIQLMSSTTELSSAAKEQEATLIQQEATTKEIALSAREISATAKEFAKSMNQFSTTASSTSQLAASGKSALAQMEMSMRQMVDAASNIAAKLSVLNEKANNITLVVTTITKVADQTNLLSLNAAIEAEKAGEFGRSFSVIAQAIRHLADQTAVATLDIEKMVSEVVSAVSASVMSVDKFSEDIRLGVQEISKIGEQLSKIITGVQALSSNFETINRGIADQATGAEQINQSITDLSQAAQHTTESIRQFHRAIEKLNDSAKELKNAVTLDESGSNLGKPSQFIES